jgi:hypothetical protein
MRALVSYPEKREGNRPIHPSQALAVNSADKNSVYLYLHKNKELILYRGFSYIKNDKDCNNRPYFWTKDWTQT